jgi:hypothetical protein
MLRDSSREAAICRSPGRERQVSPRGAYFPSWCLVGARQARYQLFAPAKSWYRAWRATEPGKIGGVRFPGAHSPGYDLSSSFGGLETANPYPRTANLGEYTAKDDRKWKQCWPS